MSMEIKEHLIITSAMLWIRQDRFPTSIIPCRKKNLATCNIQTTFCAFKRNFGGRMSQQQTSSQVSTANQQPGHGLQWGKPHTLKDPSVRQPHWKAAHSSDGHRSHASSSEDFISSCALSWTSTICSSKEHRLHSRGKAKIQLMTPIFKSWLRLQKWLMQEIFPSESFHEL